METTSRRLASISCFLAISASMLAALDDLQRAAQLGGAGAGFLFELLDALAVLAQFLAQRRRRAVRRRWGGLPACAECARSLFRCGRSSSTARRSRPASARRVVELK